MNTGLLCLLLFQGLLLGAVTMMVSWLISLRARNAGIITLAWPLLLSLLALLDAVLGDGYLWRRTLIAAMVCFWALRLALHIFVRHSRSDTENGRYTRLREAWGNQADLKFLVFFELHGVLLVILSLPFALACLNPQTQISPIEWTGAGIWAVGTLGEAIADAQLSRFRTDMSQVRKTLQSGLWKYSRHPNYFFEWVLWCGYFVFALGSPWGWVSLYCPVVVFYLLTRVTGIPLIEQDSIKTRGGPYLQYQKRTSAFFPWLPKRGFAQDQHQRADDPASKADAATRGSLKRKL